MGSESAFAGSDSAASAGGEAAAATAAAAAAAKATPLVRRTADGGLRRSRRGVGGGGRGEGASAATSRRDAMGRDAPGLRGVGVHRTRAPRVVEDYSPTRRACPYPYPDVYGHLPSTIQLAMCSTTVID